MAYEMAMICFNKCHGFRGTEPVHILGLTELWLSKSHQGTDVLPSNMRKFVSSSVYQPGVSSYVDDVSDMASHQGY
ncbi:hypothetical protein N7451_010558 [Penicillium sp. IBT 35674x]|nr:hypothetical protein N7451_010558 [Penicillium sp. IBT 35674x]